MNKIDLAAGGLALCYLVHDGEELLTYRESSRWALGRLPEGVALPAGLREHGWSQRHINIGVGLMGLNWVGAALAGLRSGGRSAWFQNALAAWTLHGFGHLGLCLLRRGYVSGAVTAPLVIGHGVWALRVLREEGVPDDRIVELAFDLRSSRPLRDPDAFLEWAMSRVEGGGERFVLLDEVQLLGDFEEVLNELSRMPGVDV